MAEIVQVEIQKDVYFCFACVLMNKLPYAQANIMHNGSYYCVECFKQSIGHNENI